MSILSRFNGLVDSTIGIFNPAAETDRLRSRMTTNALRGYDATGTGFNNMFGGLRNTTAGSEASKNSTKLAIVGQELTRNNALANRIKSQWASNVVGSGVTLDLASKKKVKKVKGKKAKLGVKDANAKESFLDDWNNWADSTDCDFDGHYNFYGMQWLWVASMVESGGIIIRKHINKRIAIPLQLQTIEQTHLSKIKDGTYSDGVVIDGIKFNKLGQRVGCYIKVEEVNLALATRNEPTYHVFGQDVIYMFRKERAGQHLGISWLHCVSTSLEKYQATQDAKITQLQIAACLSLVIKDADREVGGVVQTQTDIGTELSQGGIQHVGGGVEIETITPPNPSESEGFMGSLKDDIAAGVGLTTAQLTGDYSKFNFASGRMGKIDFFMILSFVQLNVMKPNLTHIYGWFTEIRGLTNASSSTAFKPVFTFPARSSVNPVEEFEVLFKKCRAGVISPKQLCTQLGEKLEVSIEGWTESIEMWGDLVFDTDPTKFSSAGNQLNVDDAASSNQDTATKKKKKETDDRAIATLIDLLVKQGVDNE